MRAKPKVSLDFSVHWCPRHLEPFREGWPTGASVAMLRLFEAVVADEAFTDRLPVVDGKASADALDAALCEHSPLCCWLGDERMRAIYAEVGREPPPPLN